MSTLRANLIHLRLHFQLLLAPVFLWGWLLAGGGLGLGVVLALIAFHAFLYSGATAFNSYYDRDVGPVGGLERPPPVAESLLRFSLAIQAIGLVMCLFVNATVAAIYVLFMALSVAYSHPAIRWKAHTLTSLIVVGFGQGALAFAAAWAAVRGSLAEIWSRDGLLGAVTAVFMILALYPLTQLYQVDEDAARGDRTVAVVWGAKRCFAFSLVCTALCGATMLTELGTRFGALDALIVGIGLAAQVGLVLRLAHLFDPGDTLPTYRRVMRLNRLTAAVLGGYLLARLSLS